MLIGNCFNDLFGCKGSKNPDNNQRFCIKSSKNQRFWTENSEKRDNNALMEVRESMKGKKKLLTREELVNILDD